MHKATIIYITMALVAALLLWGILAIGRHLTPPENLSGTWLPDTGATGPGTLRVEQSGHFFQIAFDDGRKADVKLVEQKIAGDTVSMKLAGGGWTFDASGRLAAGLLHWVVGGRASAAWDARRSGPKAAHAEGGE